MDTTLPLALVEWKAPVLWPLIVPPGQTASKRNHSNFDFFPKRQVK